MPHVSAIKGPAYVMSVLLLFLTVFLGGATRAGFLSDVLLQFLSIPFLLAALWMWADRLGARTGAGMARGLRPDLVLALAMLAVGGLIALAQFLPVFGSAGTGALWRHIASQGGTLSGAATGTSSLDPAMSRAALAALLPAAALFLLVALLDLEQRMRLIGWIVAIGLGCLCLGVLQVLQGPTSALRFFRFTNFEDAVGFFANRNHFAAQLYVTLPFVLVWFAFKCAGMFDNRKITAQKLQWVAVGLGLVLLILAGIALARSRAGILLTFVAFAPMVLMAPTLLAVLMGHRPRVASVKVRAAVAGGALLLLIAGLGAERAIPRFEDSSVNDLRTALNVTTSQAAWEALPFGSGLATFVPVYKVYEKAKDLLPALVNRAHNDWLEFALEAGLPGILLMLLFVGWLVLRALPGWVGVRSLTPEARLITCAASLAIGLLLIHSFLDYPLRTGAMLGYFALFCALLTPVAVPAPRRATAFA